jgi:hypothetical protein
MKHCLPALCSALLLTSCAGVRVVDTQVASGAVKPSSIYIRPFDVAGTEFIGHHAGGPGERPIRQSLAGREMADALKVELEKMAPAMVIENDERATQGWVVTGSLELVDAGSLVARHFAGHLGAGRSKVRIHVRVSDAGGSHRSVDDKDASRLSQRGHVLYEFDLAGGSGATGHLGSIYAPGLGYSAPFDYKNAAERVMMALSTDALRTGVRTTPTIRF